MASERRELSFNITWEDLDRFPVHPINLATIQPMGDDVILIFGYATPPVGIPTADYDEAKEFIENSPPVKPCHAFRLLMPAEGARQMIRGISDALEQGSDGNE